MLDSTFATGPHPDSLGCPQVRESAANAICQLQPSYFPSHPEALGSLLSDEVNGTGSWGGAVGWGLVLEAAARSIVTPADPQPHWPVTPADPQPH